VRSSRTLRNWTSGPVWSIAPTGPRAFASLSGRRAEHRDRSGVRSSEPEHHVDRGRLSRTICPRGARSLQGQSQHLSPVPPQFTVGLGQVRKTNAVPVIVRDGHGSTLAGSPGSGAASQLAMTYVTRVPPTTGAGGDDSDSPGASCHSARPGCLADVRGHARSRSSLRLVQAM